MANARFWGGNLCCCIWLVVVGDGVILVAVFFLQHLFLLLLGGLGVGFHRICFKFQVGPLFFGQISGGSSNSRVPGGFSPRQLMGSDL